MFPHVHGTESHHSFRIQFRYSQRFDVVVVYANPGSGLPALGLFQLVHWALSLPDL